MRPCSWRGTPGSPPEPSSRRSSSASAWGKRSGSGESSGASAGHDVAVEHLLVEPEVAFYDLNDNMDLAEDFMKYIIRYALDNNREDLEFLENRLLDEEKSKPQADRSAMSLIEKLNFVVDNNFVRVSYTEAIDILRNSKPNKKRKIQLYY